LIDRVVGYSQNIPFESESFDCVIMTEVLEHLSDEELELTLVEVRRVLKPNGRFLGTVPADENLELNKVVCPFCGKVFHRWGHMQSFSKERLYKLLAGKFSRVSISRHYFFYWRELNWKGKASALLKLGLLKVGVAGSDTTFFFQAYK